MDQTSEFSLENIDIKTDNDSVNWILDLFNFAVTEAARVELPILRKGLHKRTDKLNDKLKYRDDMTFETLLFDNEDLQLNLTTTTAPIFDGASNTIELHFDGLFHDQSGSHVTPNVVYPQRFAFKNSN